MALKPRAEVTRSTKQVYQWLHKKEWCPPKIKQRKKRKRSSSLGWPSSPSTFRFLRTPSLNMSSSDLNLDLTDLWLLPRWTITQMFFYCQAQIGGKRLRRSHRGRVLCPIRRLIALYDFGPKVLYFWRPVLPQSKRFLIENGQNIKKLRWGYVQGICEISQIWTLKLIHFFNWYYLCCVSLFNGHSNGRSPLFGT